MHPLKRIKKNLKLYQIRIDLDILGIMETKIKSVNPSIDGNIILVPRIIHSTRITTATKTLIDNIYSNCTNFNDVISGNLTLAISDHQK